MSRAQFLSISDGHRLRKNWKHLSSCSYAGMTSQHPHEKTDKALSRQVHHDWTENQLNCQAQRVAQQHRLHQEASHSLVDYPGDQDRGQCCSTTSLMMWMMGQSAPSASSINIQNWEVWLIHQESQLSFRGTSTGKKNRLRSPKGNAKTSIRGGITPGPRTGSGPTSWKAAWQ